jgi:uncharacterized lipoprotein YehR (DUF1307 family)
MKKILLLLVVVALVFSVTMTGCEQKAKVVKIGCWRSSLR